MPEEKQTPSDPNGVVEDTLKPEQKEEIVEQANSNPDVEVDSGEEEKAIDDVGKGAWYNNLPPDFKNDPDVTKYKSLEEYVKGNREVRKLIGKDKLVVPGKNATKDEVDKFYSKLGRPADPTGYTMPDIKELPDAVKPEESGIEAYRAKAHELGLTDKQFQELFAMQTEMTLNKYNEELEKVNNIKAEAEKNLRGEWGKAYEAKVDGAQKVINTFFRGNKMHPAFEVLANDQGFVKAMANISEKLGEDVIAGDIRTTLTPQEAQKEIAAIHAGSHDLSKAFFDDLNPEHKSAVDRVLTLQELASAG